MYNYKTAFIVIPHAKNWPNTKVWKSIVDAENDISEEIHAMRTRFKDCTQLGWNGMMVETPVGKIEIRFEVLEVPTPD